MLECVVNVSEGRDAAVLSRLAGAAGHDLLDVHTDPHHHRSVFTLVGEEAPRRVARTAVAAVDLRRHTGVHPRLGVVDVVPFVALDGSTADDAVAARDRFARWLGDELGVPGFAYGDGGPTLPQVRRGAFRSLHPTTGPGLPHPTAGATAVGARALLVAYNVWLATPDLGLARSVATALRSEQLRTLGLAVGPAVQVSCNLVAPAAVGPAEVVEAVAARAPVERAELVGLVPEVVLRRIPEERWAALDLSADRTIEARMARRAGRAT